ncbi:MAG: glycosyltransferase family 2 protein [Spirulinaceae cyanobacterium RM2_2_10]|nr:glycosyltransferase family 2 protein [Spirulinaceae cyanobacterium SM2_1_0]NJO19714.1 glycosyltransferase family 2 protein [Spirulinaceae cyanobacterium RM2_2_10]
MSYDLTIAIPTFNGAARLPRLLACLRAQVDTDKLNWEIIIVDNNSTDNTADVIREYQQDWPTDVPLHYSFEPRQGAAFARIRAVEEARGQLVGFLDDDNLPNERWVAAACDFADQHPQAGAIGSQIHPEYEVPPPENFERIASFLAIVERGEQSQLYQPAMKMLPPSAGLVVRREAWQRHAPNPPFLQGRSGKTILNSEDLESILHIQNAGWQVWYNPAMEIYHVIPRNRLTRDYLLYIVRSTGLARHYIRSLRWRPWQRPFLAPAGWLRDVSRAAIYFLQHHQELDSDTVTACEMEFLKSSVLSPFYLWRKYSGL